MKLHLDKENFDIAIGLASIYFKVSPAIIEKDYYVTLILFELVKQIPNLIFKGGTSLSKCYKIIDRFSEDIDITLDSNYQTPSRRKELKKIIIKICEEFGFDLLNENSIQSRKKYNLYIVDYSAMHTQSIINPRLIIETVFIVNSFPIEVKKASSMIYDYFQVQGNKAIIKKFELEPFDIRVQKIDRTLIDKVFALCDYMISTKTERQSRHIYDIYRILPQVKLDNVLKKLIKEVREDRKRGKMCYSAQDGITISNLLRQIIDKEVYKKDYIDNTEKLLSKPVTYEESIKALEEIIKSGVFD